ncbi:MAG: hypothetical protein RL354_1479, partial [Planctomycetota bacterium]
MNEPAGTPPRRGLKKEIQRYVPQYEDG